MLLSFNAILQFYDLEELFNTGGQVPDTSYIFMVRLLCGCNRNSKVNSL